jgi:hypothetical protein
MQDLIMSSDGETANTFAPPARIAARFHRTASTRRKSSAASSRRNSISSLHSARSNRSSLHGGLAVQGGLQSRLNAQHLRRASIIESQKARQADRAAHAEKVRLRAALAKAAPRASSTREDRAMAAQQARERYLAQVAANCAEEVKRAKKIAKDMKEKKAADNLRLKGDMEEKLADAERRRLLYQQNLRRSRTTSLPSVEEKKVVVEAWKPKSQEAAARVIQKAWKNSRRRQVVSDFVALDLTLATANDTAFEALSTLLAQEQVLAISAKLMKFFRLLDDEGGAVIENAAARPFLSAFLILSHPEQVFNQREVQEEDLMAKAKSLVMLFESMVRSVSKKHGHHAVINLPPSQLASLADAYSAFQIAFTAWKNEDSSVLIETMVAQFAELDAIWLTVKKDMDQNVAAAYKDGIQHNQALLIVRLKRLAGPERALQLIREAVRERRKARAKSKPLGDIKPRGSVEAHAASAGGGQIGATGSNGAQLHSDRSMQLEELNKVASPMPDNRTLIHELSINNSYRIEHDSTSEIRNAINTAVFDAMRSDVQANLADDWILAMAYHIRERLLRVVSPRNPLYGLISESLDTKITKKQLEIGNFSYEKFFSFMNSILPKICAPVRDHDVKALAADDSDDYIGRLAKLMRLLDLLSLDHANHHLAVASPMLIREAAAYEQQCFGQQFRDGNLPKTLRWWTRSRNKALTELSRRVPESSAASPSTPTSDKIYMQGLVDLFVSFPPLATIDVPETLQHDHARIEKARATILHVVTVSTILLTAKNLLKRDVRSAWKAQAQRMWDLPPAQQYVDAAAYLSVIESTHTLPPPTRTTLAGTIARVLGDARATPAITHPVMQVLLQKLRAHVLGRLRAASAEERLRGRATASEVLGTSGLVEFIGQVGALVEEMERVKQADWAAHGRWLDAAAAEVAATAAAGAGPVAEA